MSQEEGEPGMALSRLAQLVAQLNKSTLTRHKIDILRAHADLKDVLLDIYSDRAFGVTSKAIGVQGTSGDAVLTIRSLRELVEMLKNGELKNSTNSATALTLFARDHPEHLELIKNIIDKNLKARIGPQLLRRAFGTGDSSLPVALGHQLPTIDDTIAYIDSSIRNDGGAWMASRKIDGVRCVVRIDVDRQVTLLSRQGRPFRSAYLNSVFKHHFDPLLRLPFEHHGQPVYIDGELAVIDDPHCDRFVESFTDTVKVCMSEVACDQLLERLHYFMFDCVTESELYAGNSTSTGGTIHSNLSTRLQRLIPSSERLHLLPQLPLPSTGHEPAAHTINELCTNAHRHHWEGLILRRDAPYKGGRSRDILKVKLFTEEEFRVVDMEVARMRVFVGGVEREQVVCKALLVDFDGQNRVAVGSGLSGEERVRFAEDPQLVLNKFITVKYFERSRNERGIESLRFPIFKCIRVL